MQNERWQQIKTIFHDALALAETQRDLFLAEKCGKDAEMRHQLEKLLAAHFEADSFIEKPAAKISEVIETNNRFQLPKRLGNYLLYREIGVGGMGAVFLANRVDGEFQQKVAVKIIRQTIADSQIVKRFKAERQILAGLLHPNIVQLLDGGTTPEGMPFLVMEYVEGWPLLDFCQNHKLALKTRLKIFQKICAAVSFAHQHLIIHRDIKPTNILVTNEGEPKLLDFGLAKILATDVPNSTHTQTGFRALTPAYASPEQFQGKNITTASDIYSLGVILYELLSGKRPLETDNCSYDEILRQISTSEPIRPSAVMGKTEGVKRRKGDREDFTVFPSPFHPFSPSALKGDLDNIALKALRKEPERRYQSAQQFSADIERFLRGLPVSARPNTFTYLATKFIKRHALVVAAGGLILLSLIGGIIATAWQAQKAQREKAKAELINTFLTRMLKYANPVYKSAQKGGQDLTIKEVLDEAATRLDRGEFDNQPEVKAELSKTIAQTYMGQSKYQTAEPYIRQYAALTKQLYGENHPKTIESQGFLAASLFDKGQPEEAEKLYRHVFPLIREEQKRGRINAETLANILNNFGYLRRTQGDSKEAESAFRESLSLNPQMPEDEVSYINGTTRSVLASTLADQGKFDEALEASREAVNEQRQKGEINTPVFGFNLTILSGFLTEKGEYQEADANLRNAEEIIRKNLSPKSLWLGDNLRNQSVSLYFQGKFVEAIAKANETQKIYEESFGKHYDNYPTVLIYKGLSLVKIGQMAEGEKLLREAVEQRSANLPKEHYWVAIAKSALGECLTDEKKFAEAEINLKESYESLVGSQGANNPRTLLARSRLAKLYANWKPELAAKYQ
jgi:serine/threonine-protein kinase